MWSARVTNERAAWELLSLIDQIHIWAITEFRTFVTEHLKPWHKFCDDNYLLDWKSVYDVKPELKQMRTCSVGTDLPLPSWAKLLTDPAQQRVQARAQNSLVEALQKHHQRKGKGRCETEPGWHCMKDQCATSTEIFTSEAFLDHLRDLHHYPEDHLARIKHCVDKVDEEERDEEQWEELDGGAIDVFADSIKRCCVEEDGLNGSSSSSSSGCISGPSKRVKVA